MSNKKLLIIMTILVILFAGLWITTRNDLKTITGNLDQEAQDYDEKIKEDCNPLLLNDADGKAKCKETLDKFAATIKEYQDKVAESDR